MKRYMTTDKIFCLFTLFNYDIYEKLFIGPIIKLYMIKYSNNRKCNLIPSFGIHIQKISYFIFQKLKR